MIFGASDGETFAAASDVELVELMHATSWAPCDSDAQWMKEVAGRAKIQTGAPVRFDVAEHFIADLIAAGLLERVTEH